MAEPLIKVENLKKYFPVKGGVLSKTIGWVRAVEDVSFHISQSETLGLVGESGCGKTTVGRSILRLIEPTSGMIVFEGVDLCSLSKKEMRTIRRQMQIIFQDPFASLNPRMTVASIVGEPLTIHKVARGQEKRERVAELLRRVGLQPEHMNRYPHEFSGGQRQRIGIARALALNPRLIVGDEPVSALDVSIQAQVINLLEDLQDEFQLSYLMIAHNMSVVQHICDRVAVMYLGRIAELAANAELYSNPLHPYTVALLSAVPVPDPTRKKERIVLEGDVPSPANPPPGCYFHPRCPRRFEPCSARTPKLIDVGNEHYVACFLHHDKAYEDDSKVR